MMSIFTKWQSKPKAMSRLDYPDVPSNRPLNALQKYVDQVRTAQNQLSNVEYGIVLGIILSKTPSNILVFGLGRDSDLWVQANRGGTTVFLEDIQEWFRDVDHAQSYLVKYPGLVLPEEVTCKKWDVILVDGPMGYKPEHPGREESIKAASTLVAPGGVVFVHDLDREAEKRFALKYLGTAVAELDRIGVYVSR